jgi:hypothetical protein
LLSNEIPLPIQLASHSASVVRNNDVEVVWGTISETNNYGFEIERRRINNGSSGANPHPEVGDLQWVKIAFVEGHGTTLASQSYSYIDRAVSFGRYFYRIRQIDLDGKVETFPEMEVNVGIEPGKLLLVQNYPNPFNPSTTIEFVVPQAGRVSLKVYNLLGQEVATLFNANAEAGRLYCARFDGANVPGGAYWYSLSSTSRIESKRMLLLK